MVTFYNQEQTIKQTSFIEDLPRIRKDTIEKGAKIVEKSGTGWDYQTLREEFSVSLMNGFSPENVNGAFINFVKKKVTTTP